MYKANSTGKLISNFESWEDNECMFEAFHDEKDVPASTQYCDSPAPDSLDSIVFSNTNSLESFKKFRDSVIKRIQESADKMPLSSPGCPSNESEIHSIFKDLNDELKDVNNDTVTDKDGKTLTFFELFMVRYRQVCKDRKSVKVSDLREFTDMLEYNYRGRRRQQITNFDAIMKF